MALQATENEMHRQLRHNFAIDEKDSLWCWIYPQDDKCSDDLKKKEGALVRLVQLNGDYYSFVSGGRHYTTTDVLMPTFYLLHKSEFKIKWMGSGPNAVGCMLFGSEMELDWWAIAERDEFESDY